MSEIRINGKKGFCMRDHSKHIELSRDEAVSNMLDALPPCFGKCKVEQISLEDAFNRVLAQDIAYATDIPNVLTCCMDSIALRWSDFEECPRGDIPDTSEWVRGVNWEFANTGVAMPAGFDTAIVIEHVEVSDDEQHISIKAAPSKQFAGTREAASQHRAGDVAARKGSLITPDVAAAIAGAGHSSVRVLAKPRVAFIPTGDELVPANLPFSNQAPNRFAGRGKVYESNSLVVRGKVEKWGGLFVPFDIVPDEKDAIREAVQKACEVADIVVINAGSSKGSDDWSVEILEELGSIICHQTNHGPGHHSSYAIVDDTPIVGISGPSGGASFTLNFYLLPIMKRFLGQDPAPCRIPAILAGEFKPGKMEKLAGKDSDKLAGEQRPPEATKPDDVFFSIKFLTLEAGSEGTLLATPVAGHAGSPATQHANAYCMLPAGPGASLPHVGDVIHVELRDS